MRIISNIREFLHHSLEPVYKVDKDNRVVGKISRLNAFILGKHFRGIQVYLFKDSSYQELLLEKRTPWIRFPGQYGECGGAVTYGMTARDAAYKELSEELFSGREQHLEKRIVLEHLGAFFDGSARPGVWTDVFTGVYPGPFYPSRFEVESVGFKPVSDIEKEILDYHRKKYTPPFIEGFKFMLGKIKLRGFSF